MKQPPPYFDLIRSRASGRWDQLEADPELAGPWHQLFKQVQSPRHVVSELLQNADDAGATEAAVRIDGDRFIFTHDGEDFRDEHFASLCRFGYSNKRALHTIGFRGIGFKSTFSLGDPVELRTPTLNVAFHRARFTEPRWLGSPWAADTGTELAVAIEDGRRKREIEKNLEEWLASPVSLLFFKNIRRLLVGDRELHWESFGPGPVAGTEWMALTDDPDHPYLLATSDEQPFPEEALAEIRSERQLGPEAEAEFPPCRVEIVLGAAGRLYVVLPTGVQTSLPFACNAPFIQDPARLKIKDPETSPTNRWLLERAGALAASVMLRWVGNDAASIKERSGAYAFLPEVDRDDASLEGSCAVLVDDACVAALTGERFLLTDSGELRGAGGCVALPNALLNVWPAEELPRLLDPDGRPALARHVPSVDRAKLARGGHVAEIGRSQVIDILTAKHLPRPSTWRGLMRLWAYVSPGLTGWLNASKRRSVRIVPVQGKDVLYSTTEVVRLGDKRLLQSDEDWEFLSSRLLVLNPNWPRYILEQRREAEERTDAATLADASAANQLLEELELTKAADLNLVLEQVAGSFFTASTKTVGDCVRLAQIAAKLGASAGASFRFVTRDGYLRPSGQGIYFDAEGTLEEMLPSTWLQDHLLHGSYSREFQSCSEPEWKTWVSSGRAGLLEFVPLATSSQTVWGLNGIKAELVLRGFEGELSLHFKTNRFQINDWDFSPAAWQHWSHLATANDAVWARVFERLAGQPASFWTPAVTARALHVSQQNTTRLLTQAPLLPRWILRLREVPCLVDTHGRSQKPGDLLRRTPATEPLLDVEPFVHGRLDTEANRPLLDLLGVRSTPTGPRRLLACLRALAMSDQPPVAEVDKWYRRLDQLLDSCSTAEASEVRQAFREEKLVLTESSGWTTQGGAFLSADEEDAPGAPVVRAAVRDLSLWRKLGMAERPTAELAIAWLQNLPSGDVLSSGDLKRVRALLGRHSIRIWQECGHWLALDTRWQPVRELKYAVSMQSLVEWGHLHEWVKQRTADLRSLPVELTTAHPFSDLPSLAAVIEERVHRAPTSDNSGAAVSWLNVLGGALSRVVLDDEVQTQRIRSLAEVLRETRLQSSPHLEVVPYIDGAPAGTPRATDVLWSDRVLFVKPLPAARMARLIPERLGRIFSRVDVSAALSYCLGRADRNVLDYMEENFTLAPVEHTEPAPASPSPAQDPPHSEPASEAPPPGAQPGASDLPVDEIGDADEADAPSGDQLEDPAPTAGDEEETPGSTRAKPSSRPVQASVLERFALAEGFRRDGADRFVHANGGWIAREGDDLFPWERWSGAGELVCRYWVKDHCLDREPLQLPAEVWAFLDSHAATCALVLTDEDDAPTELPGERLRAMRDAGQLTLYPATYRLVRAQ